MLHEQMTQENIDCANLGNVRIIREGFWSCEDQRTPKQRDWGSEIMEIKAWALLWEEVPV